MPRQSNPPLVTDLKDIPVNPPDVTFKTVRELVERDHALPGPVTLHSTFRNGEISGAIFVVRGHKNALEILHAINGLVIE